MDDQVEVVVHDREAPHLDPAEVGDGDDPLHQTLLHLVGLEQHRAVGDAGRYVIDAVIDGHSVLSGHMARSFRVTARKAAHPPDHPGNTQMLPQRSER